MNKKTNLTQASIKKIDNFLNSVENDIEDYQFFNEFPSIVLKDVKMIKDCAESSIVDFYIETCKQLLNKYDYEIYDDFYKDLKEKTRLKLVDKYVSKATFDNNIDIYFNEVKREYIMHPMGESEDMAFVPENRDVFIKNNLKLVIDCAKRYQNLGLPLEDLIQAGNEGLLITFNKFDTDRANLRFAILDDIKKASFSSIAFAWIRATIISEINKLGKIIRVPKSTKTDSKDTLNIIRLDSVNPHTDDCYHDNQISETANDDFAIIDESIENMEKQNLFKVILDKVISNLPAIDRRIIKKKFGIDAPFQMSINEIAENEGISPNKIKYIISNTLKTIEKNISPKDKKYIIELLK